MPFRAGSPMASLEREDSTGARRSLSQPDCLPEGNSSRIMRRNTDKEMRKNSAVSGMEIHSLTFALSQALFCSFLNFCIHALARVHTARCARTRASRPHALRARTRYAPARGALEHLDLRPMDTFFVVRRRPPRPLRGPRVRVREFSTCPTKKNRPLWYID